MSEKTDETILVEKRRLLDTILEGGTLAIITLVVFGLGYSCGRPRTIHIVKAESTKAFKLRQMPGEPCSVVTNDREWQVVCGLW